MGKVKKPVGKISSSPGKQIPQATFNLHKFSSDPTAFVNNGEDIFQALHLAHEEIKLNKLRSGTEGPKLRKLLASWLLLSDDPYSKSAFLTYYISES